MRRRVSLMAFLVGGAIIGCSITDPNRGHNPARIVLPPAEEVTRITVARPAKASDLPAPRS